MLPARRVLAALATVCFSGAVALTPAEVRSRLDRTRADAPPPAAAPPPLAVVVPDGDPFVPRAPDDTATPAAAAAAAAALPLAPRAPDGPIVRAIVTGDRPSALVDDGTATRLVGPGDRVAGATVTGIDANGIALDDGRRIALPAAGEIHR
jgi:hypothetical protein